MRRSIFLALLSACGPTSGAGLDQLPARTAVVGQELTVMLHTQAAASTSFSSDLDLATRQEKPTLTAFDGGLVVFTWIPLGGDVGDHFIEFDTSAASVRMDVTVIAGAAGLTFREPAGEGTSLDAARVPCAVVSILVDDTSAPAVTLSRGDVWSEPGTLKQDGPLSGTLKFCPSKSQVQAGSIWQFSIVADDHAGGRAEKHYAVVLSTLPSRPAPAPTSMPDMGPPASPDMGPPAPTCGQVPPTIVHTPHSDITTTGNLHLYDEVTDPDGVYDSTVYWSLTAPADSSNPDLTQMTALPMTFTGGSTTDSKFAATLHNPNLGAPSGTVSTIWYVIAATDADDAVAGCSYHTTTTALYSFSVTQP